MLPHPFTIKAEPKVYGGEPAIAFEIRDSSSDRPLRATFSAVAGESAALAKLAPLLLRSVAEQLAELDAEILSDEK